MSPSAAKAGGADRAAASNATSASGRNVLEFTCSPCRECIALVRRGSGEGARRSDCTARRASEELGAGGGVGRGRALCPSARRDAAPGGERQRDEGAWPGPSGPGP